MLNIFFVANSIEDVEKQRAILSMVIGLTTYRLFRSLIAPAKLNEKTYQELVDALREHHSPTPSEIVQRFKFNTRFRQPGESISEPFWTRM